MEMKSDISNYLGRIFGILLIILGLFGGLFLLMFVNVWLGIIIGIILVAYGKFLTFKADRRRGHILYEGGSI